MSDVLIFAGTSEGKEIALELASYSIPVDVCVATEYGKEVLPDSPFIQVFEGRMNLDQMKAFYKEHGTKIIIDATHPHAKLVSQTIQKSTNLPVLRYTRSLPERDVYCTYVSSVEECIETLKTTSGMIFLSTGSKDLHLFAKEYKERIVVRTLPSVDSLQLCKEAGIEGKQIIAMQGPFSKDMNVLQLKEKKASILVMKESGKTGGQDTKIEAAKELGIPCIVIASPQEKSLSKKEVLDSVCKVVGKPLQSHISIFLIGIGMGNLDTLTIQAKNEIDKCQVLFGAKRMLENFNSKKRFPYYRAEDIIPILKELQERISGTIFVGILFSGDTGFFSGGQALLKELKTLDNCSIQVLPGISSIQYLASQIQIPWQDLEIVSFHGVKNWKEKCLKLLQNEKSFFFISSGRSTIQEIGNMDFSKYDLFVGYQLSYSQQWVRKLNNQDCLSLQEEGLYCGIFLRKESV